MKDRMQKSKFKKLSIMLVIIFLFISTIGNVQASNNTNQENYIIEEVFDKDYWDWHTRTTINDKAYNGEHIKISDNNITFYGYGQDSYKDFLYKEFSYTGKKTFRIKVDEKAASYHTLEGAGFLINSKIKDDKISGYVLLYTQRTIDIYRINNVNLEQFKTTKNMKLSNYGQLVKSMAKNTSGIHNVIVETTPTYIKVTDNNQSMKVDLDSTKHTGDSFGLISSYLQHDCSILSTIIFEKFELEIENYTIPVKTINQEEKPLAGASYEIKNDSGEVVRTGSSNTEGIFNMVGLQEGIYTIKQVSAPSGYQLNTNVITFKVTNEGKAIDIDTGEEFEIVFMNEPIPKEEDKKEETKNEIDNTIQNTTNQEKLPDRLPQTGMNLKMVTIFIIFIIAIIYFAIKIRKYDDKE